MEKIKNDSLEIGISTNLIVGKNILYPNDVNVIINDLNLNELE